MRMKQKEWPDWRVGAVLRQNGLIITISQSPRPPKGTAVGRWDKEFGVDSMLKTQLYDPGHTLTARSEPLTVRGCMTQHRANQPPTELAAGVPRVATWGSISTE